MNFKEKTYQEALDLLKKLIRIPSFSGKEQEAADLLENFLKLQDCTVQRIHQNVVAFNKHFDTSKPTVLLNSHHDTVKPNKSYTRNPFDATEEADKLYGLGSNDAGASLVSLIQVFCLLQQRNDLSFNLIMAATGEEENSGRLGVESFLPLLPEIDVAIVGEPTGMELAIAEKGLLVIDAYAYGIAGHAAHIDSKNAIDEALQDILHLHHFEFPKVSETLGKVKVTVTQIEAGTQHNVVPDSCHFVIDIRVNDCYSNQEIFEILDQQTKSTLIPRSLRLNASGIPASHPIVQAGIACGFKTYGSPTLSDQALLPFPSVKIGPGASVRSHTADEYIFVDELKQGIDGYLHLLNNLNDHETLG